MKILEKAKLVKVGYELLRIFLAVVFILYGWKKLDNPESFAFVLKNIGLPHFLPTL